MSPLLSFLAIAAGTLTVAAINIRIGMLLERVRHRRSVSLTLRCEHVPIRRQVPHVRQPQ